MEETLILEDSFDIILPIKENGFSDFYYFDTAKEFFNYIDNHEIDFKDIRYVAGHSWNEIIKNGKCIRVLVDDFLLGYVPNQRSAALYSILEITQSGIVQMKSDLEIYPDKFVLKVEVSCYSENIEGQVTDGQLS